MHTILTQLNILMSLYVPFQIALLKHTGGKGIDDVESYRKVRNNSYR